VPRGKSIAVRGSASPSSRDVYRAHAAERKNARADAARAGRSAGILGTADYRAGYAFSKRHVVEFSQLDAALNRLDAYAASAAARAKDANAELVPLLAGVRAKALALRGRLTADYTNDEDSIQHPAASVKTCRVCSTAQARRHAATLDYAARVDRAFDAAMRDVAAFERGDVARADAALSARESIRSRGAARSAPTCSASRRPVQMRTATMIRIAAS